MDNEQSVFGEAMQRAFAERGYEMSLEQAREFVRTLLYLFDINALVFVDENGDRIPQA